ncbi:MAG: aldehyde ferredoxin oxidoreductase family protein [Bacillota bacterium]
MAGGFCDRILRVDLAGGGYRLENPGETFFRRFMGGRALIGHVLRKELTPGTEPLGPGNKLVFAAGVLTGLPVAGSGRHSIGAKSPLTGAYGDSEAGGFFGAALKAAGYDAIIIEGQSSRPVYLYVTRDAVEIKDASELWGKSTGEVQLRLKEAHGREARVAQCGPAGEQLVPYACVVHDLKHFAGRTGMGAVMGSKRLRAVVVRGDAPPVVADGARLKEINDWMLKNVFDLQGVLPASRLRELGTSGGVEILNGAGGLPTLNFREGTFEHASSISGTAIRDRGLMIGRGTCFACPIACKRVVGGEEPPIDPAYGGPEYESIAALGSMCGVEDAAWVCKANEVCAALGLDTISAGVTVAFAMECFERGILTTDHTGLDLRFGNGPAVVEVLELIAARKGIGKLLAQGSYRAAQELGEEALGLAMHVKGQEIPMHEPRVKPGLGVGYAVSPTGADHGHNFHDTGYDKLSAALQALAPLGIIEPVPIYDLGPAKVRMLYYVLQWKHFQDCAVLCRFVPWNIQQTLELVQAATGWDASLWELLKVGERAINLTRDFNCLHGFTAADDVLPGRFFTGHTRGPATGRGLDREAFTEACRLYYAMAGWNREGVPGRAKLAELDIL